MTPIKLANFKFTFEAFPILVAGMLMGPMDGFIVGAVGSAIYQLLFSGYGITLTTPLWILPYAISGFIVGLYAKSKNHKLNFYQTVFICCISAFVVSGLNLLAIYVDSKVYGYYSDTLVFGNLLIKIITGIILATIYSTILPRLISFLKKKLKQ